MEQEAQLKLETLKREIGAISSKLKQLSEQKEKAYKDKLRVDNQLNSFIKFAQEMRSKKGEIDKAIKDLKVKREEFNRKIKSMWEELNKLKYEVKRQATESKKDKKRGILPTPELQKKIKELEMAVQIEGYGFEKEKKVMGQIKLLKLELEERQGSKEQQKEVEEKREEIRSVKKDADSFHKKIQDFARQGSELFESLTHKSEDISRAKEKRKETQLALKNLKEQIEALNMELADKLSMWTEISKEAPPVVRQTPEDVMGKLKEKKKLTKDDLLVMQRKSRPY